VQGVAYGLVRMYQSSAAPFSKGRACRPGWVGGWAQCAGKADVMGPHGSRWGWRRPAPAAVGAGRHRRV